MRWACASATLKLRKNPDCPVCGTHPTVTELIDYDQFCGIQPAGSGRRHVINGIEQIDRRPTFKQQQRCRQGLLPARRARAPRVQDRARSAAISFRWAKCRIALASSTRIATSLSIARCGGRSQKAAEFLQQAGFKVHNLAGGIQAWSEQIDPKVAKY